MYLNFSFVRMIVRPFITHQVYLCVEIFHEDGGHIIMKLGGGGGGYTCFFTYFSKKFMSVEFL